MSALNNSALIGASGSTGYQISRSVRLRSSASAYFNRTPASAGNRKTWTWSGWVKRGTLTSNQILMSSDVGTVNATWAEFGFDSSDRLYLGFYTGTRYTTPIYRDPSAWYHVVVAFDTTQSVEVDRVKFYVNGVQQTQTGDAGFPAQNTDYGINNNQIHDIGRRNWASGVGRYFDGYLTEVNFIDGQALTPSSFGEFDATTGVWKPKKYAGTYGTNGFYLNFSDNSGATATTIGKDSSGNGNNWTPNNISVTSGVTYDSMLDVPTPWPDGGNGRGNYAVLNPLQKGSVITVSAANLQFASSSGNSYCPSTIGATTGKWYCEVFMTSVSTAAIVGIVNENASLATYPGGNANGYGYFRDGQKYTNGSGSAYGNSYTDNDIIGIALDLDNGKVWFSKNGTWQASGDPAAGTNAAFTGISATNTWFFACGNSGVTTQNANFGQRPFAYTPPSGFKALNTFNLPVPTIANGANYFAATTYAGTNSTLAVTNSGGFQPDLVWIKNRSLVTAHVLQDAVRGATAYISSNATAAENTNTANNWFRSFDASGFTVSNLTTGGTNTTEWNNSGYNYVGWQWKEGATQGFDIVLYTGNSTASRSINHSLGVTPSMIIVKNRSAVQNWPVAHTSLTVGNLLTLDTTGASTAAGTRLRLGDSSAFTVGDAADYGITNQTGQNYVAYCFAAIAGFSRFGSYTGNGSADGPFVFCGFRPRWVMLKRTDSAPNEWFVQDTSVNTYNLVTNYLYPNSSSAEQTNGALDILSNGFKLRNSYTTQNASGGTYIYAAFAENPFKYSLAR